MQTHDSNCAPSSCWFNSPWFDLICWANLRHMNLTKNYEIWIELTIMEKTFSLHFTEAQLVLKSAVRFLLRKFASIYQTRWAFWYSHRLPLNVSFIFQKNDLWRQNLGNNKCQLRHLTWFGLWVVFVIQVLPSWISYMNLHNSVIHAFDFDGCLLLIIPVLMKICVLTSLWIV